jgi:hypothetical protein
VQKLRALLIMRWNTIGRNNSNIKEKVWIYQFSLKPKDQKFDPNLSLFETNLKISVSSLSKNSKAFSMGPVTRIYLRWKLKLDRCASGTARTNSSSNTSRCFQSGFVSPNHKECHFRKSNPLWFMDDKPQTQHTRHSIVLSYLSKFKPKMKLKKKVWYSGHR